MNPGCTCRGWNDRHVHSTAFLGLRNSQANLWTSTLHKRLLIWSSRKLMATASQSPTRIRRHRGSGGRLLCLLQWVCPKKWGIPEVLASFNPKIGKLMCYSPTYGPLFSWGSHDRRHGTLRPAVESGHSQALDGFPARPVCVGQGEKLGGDEIGMFEWEESNRMWAFPQGDIWRTDMSYCMSVTTFGWRKPLLQHVAEPTRCCIAPPQKKTEFSQIQFQHLVVNFLHFIGVPAITPRLAVWKWGIPWKTPLFTAV